MKRKIIQITALLYTGMLPAAVMAHTGDHGSYSFLQGIMHPLLGLDHLAAMCAVGLWAATMPKAASRKVMSTFIAALLFGAVLAATGVVLPGIEAGIASSVLVAGLLLTAYSRIRPTVGMALVAVFALFHGQAHLIEAPDTAAILAYGAGIIVFSTAMLLASRSLGYIMRSVHAEWVLRGAGVVSGGFGAWLMLGA